MARAGLVTADQIKDFCKMRGRIPTPRQTGGAHSTPKGKKGYDRKEDRRIVREIRGESARRIIE